MPRVRPLNPGEAQRTLAQRLAGRADRIRQLNTRFGLRARRVFLTHTVTDGEERGEGTERVLNRAELLPTPRVTDASAINLRPWSGGVLPEGSIRVDQISVSRYTLDVLTGVRFADGAFAGQLVRSAQPVSGSNEDPRIWRQVSFFYEIVEDGRGDNPAQRDRFRVLGNPWRAEGQFGFGVLLESESEPMGRDGDSAQQDMDV